MLISVVIYPDLVDEVSWCWRWLIMEISSKLFLNVSPFSSAIHEGHGGVCAVTHGCDVRLVMQLQTHLSLIVWQAQNVQLWGSFKLQLVRPNLLSSSMLHVPNEREMQDSVLKNLGDFLSLHTGFKILKLIA